SCSIVRIPLPSGWCSSRRVSTPNGRANMAPRSGAYSRSTRALWPEPRWRLRMTEGGTMQLSEAVADEAPTTSRWASALAHATEIPAALLVLAEIAILGGGAFTRYVLHQPITWTDELAS